jgi:hypothetical protein
VNCDNKIKGGMLGEISRVYPDRFTSTPRTIPPYSFFRVETYFDVGSVGRYIFKLQQVYRKLAIVYFFRPPHRLRLDFVFFGGDESKIGIILV